VKADHNQPITAEEFQHKKAELAAVIDGKFGQIHPVAKRPRLEPAAAAK
jgi:hypothetical protein